MSPAMPRRTGRSSPRTTRPRLNVGTVIVREVLDAQGAISSITAIAKGPPGLDPTLGDWWFAKADPSGSHSCHVPRAAEDYLFGVPRTDQARRN